jgi:hypothetical protein
MTDRQFGPVHLALAHVQTQHGYEEWALVSDDPTDLHTFDEYGLRFDLEENFLDDKSAGFNWNRHRSARPRTGLRTDGFARRTGLSGRDARRS